MTRINCQMIHILCWKIRKSTLVKFSKIHFLLGYLVRIHQNLNFSSKIKKFYVCGHKNVLKCHTTMIIISRRSLGFKEVSWIPCEVLLAEQKHVLTPKSQQWVKQKMSNFEWILGVPSYFFKKSTNFTFSYHKNFLRCRRTL